MSSSFLKISSLANTEMLFGSKFAFGIELDGQLIVSSNGFDVLRFQRTFQQSQIIHENWLICFRWPAVLPKGEPCRFLYCVIHKKGTCGLEFPCQIFINMTKMCFGLISYARVLDFKPSPSPKQFCKVRIQFVHLNSIITKLTIHENVSQKIFKLKIKSTSITRLIYYF